MESNSREQLAQRIRLFRKRAGLKQEEVADAVGIDSKSLSRIEQGKHYPALDTLESIGRKLGVPLREFFEFPEHQENLEEVRKRLKEYADALPEDQVRSLLRMAKDFALKNGPSR